MDKYRISQLIYQILLGYELDQFERNAPEGSIFERKLYYYVADDLTEEFLRGQEITKELINNLIDKWTKKLNQKAKR